MAAEDVTGGGRGLGLAAWPDSALIDLRDLFAILWSRRLVIGVCTLVTVLLAGLYLVVTPPLYLARAILLIDPQQPKITESQNVMEGVGRDAAMVESQVEVIRSRQLLEPVFRDFDIEHDPEFARENILSRVLGWFGPTQEDLRREQIYNRFEKALSVERRGLTYILSVAFKSEDRTKAAEIANLVAGRYVAHQVSEKSGTTTEVTHLLQDRAGELQNAVAVAEQAVEAFKAKAGLVDFASQPALFESELMEVNRQLVAAENDANAARVKYEQLARLDRSAAGLLAMFRIVDSPIATALRSQYNEKEAQLQRLDGMLGLRHPTMLSLKQELSAVRDQMAVEADRIVEALRSYADAADGKVAELRGRIETLKARTAGLRRAEVEARALERDADARRGVLEQYLRRSQETGGQQTLQRPDAEIISSAVPPVRPVWPRASLVLALAALAGLGLGATLALLLRPEPPSREARLSP